MSKATIHFRLILAEPAQRELLTAFLGEGPFIAFVDTEAGVDAWCFADDRPQAEAVLTNCHARFRFEWTAEWQAAENWNARWEAAFEPVRVGEFARIRASFHPTDPSVRFDLLIEPRMAFGTGHHATTYQMMQLMQSLNWSGKSVLDFGCGTGVLAILAVKLGASPVEAVDIESAAVENTLENAAANGVELSVFEGTLADVPDEQPADIILANINRNVILEALPTLYQRLRLEGSLLISGILQTDGDLLRSRLRASQFQIVTESEREGWLAFHVRKTAGDVA